MRNLGLISTTAAAALVGLGGPSAPTARAQSAPSAGGVVQALPSAGGYVPVYVAPGRAPAVVWRSYAPGSAWITPRYDPRARRVIPQATWPSYSPIPGGGAFRPIGRMVRRLRQRGQPISSMNLEYGTGRSVGMIKPWLPHGVN